ncbi:polyferredoxin [Caldicoprobacter guelmensis]|uniref:4Fe-4S binding protein n=1 Tax=Caldicoprobacter guelmensis TaxID=1170224 RepID=UPI00195BF71F|nr:4Fe-4S binding protein [Caldicoprobacter guelmensis]MBM7582836.1 polyferredoxin [Caldicoprobacter guelmensis]
MAKAVQVFSQWVFVVLFFMLVDLGRIHLWMGIFILSVILTPFLGRFYCGWLCPINTVMNIVTRIKQRFHIKDLAVPESLRKPVYRYLVLFTFFLLFTFVMVSGKKLPVLPGLLTVGVLLTLFFTEKLWHRYLCPYGTILSMMGKLSRRGYQVIEQACISCGICSRVCPADAVRETSPLSSGGGDETKNFSIGDKNLHKKTYGINKKECLLCGICADRCPKNAIVYR